MEQNDGLNAVSVGAYASLSPCVRFNQLPPFELKRSWANPTASSEDKNNIACFYLETGLEGRRSITHCVQEGAGEILIPRYRTDGHMAMTAANFQSCGG